MYLPAPTAVANVRQCLSAPARPPKSAPLPEPVLVTKKVIADCCAVATPTQSINSTIDASVPNCRVIIGVLHELRAYREPTRGDGQGKRACRPTAHFLLQMWRPLPVPPHGAWPWQALQEGV